MPAENRNGPRFAFIPIQWLPGYWRLSAIVARARVNTSLAARTVEGIKYKNWELADPIAIQQGCGEYVFSEAVNPVDERDVMEFIWNPPITEEQRLTPFLDYNDTKAHPWPDVVVSMGLIIDSAGDRKMSVKKKPGGTYETKCRIRHYVSDAPFSDYALKTNEPVVSDLDWWFLAGSYIQTGTVQNCLHPLVVFPHKARLEIDCTPTTPDPLNGTQKVYPPTNHIDWIPHTISCNVTEDNGLFHLVKTDVYPPKLNTFVVT
jgi:hypothetical protein